MPAKRPSLPPLHKLLCPDLDLRSGKEISTARPQCPSTRAKPSAQALLRLDRLLAVVRVLLAMSLVDALAFKASSTPVRSAILPAGAYVLAIASTPSYYAASASSPSNAIHVFDKARLQNVQTFSGHDSSITALRSVPNVANTVAHALLSSGKDGAVKVWDERSGSVALRSEHQLCFPPQCKAKTQCEIAIFGSK